MDRPDIKNPYNSDRTATGFFKHEGFQEGVEAAAAYYEGIMAQNKREWDDKQRQVMDAKDDYYRDIVIPQKIKEAEEKLIAGLEGKVIGGCLRLDKEGINTCDDCGDQSFNCPAFELALIKKSRGIA